MSATINRQIIHVDMDAFYAAVEQRDNPELRGKPVVIGGKPNSRGVASTCSYEARKYGIHSAMPLAEAYRRCPQALFLPVNSRKYRQVSDQLRGIFQTYTPLVEPLSLDEAFLDVTASRALFGAAIEIAQTIKQRIKLELDLTASVGVAPNKFLAKLASDLRKPDGFVVVESDKVQSFLDPLPVERIWGVGRRTAERLHSLNIKQVRDLRLLDKGYLAKLFGVSGAQLYQLARGIDDRTVEAGREAKSIGREVTFAQDIADKEELQTTLLELAVDVGRQLRKEALRAKTVSVKARYSDFRTVTRSHTLDGSTNLDEDIYAEACALLNEVQLKDPLRLIGVSLSNLTDREDQQLELFGSEKKEKEKLARVVDAVKERFGEGSITRARLVERKE